MAKRKSNRGSGSVYLRKDGRWEGRYVIGRNEKGLPKTKNVLAKTKRECEEKLKALRNSLKTARTGAAPQGRHDLWGVAGPLVSNGVQVHHPAQDPGGL